MLARVWPRRLCILALALVAGACATTARVPSPDANVRIDRIDQKFDLDAKIARIAIDNPWGEINVRGRDEREVGIHAIVQRLTPSSRGVKFRTRREGDTLRILVDYESLVASEARPVRADIAVYVPGDLALSLTARDGRIDAKRRPGPIEATTDSGDINASSLGRLTLKSRSGQIRAIAIGKRWTDASEIATESGRIVLLVPTFGDVALDARTGGKLSTGFGLSVHATPDGGHEAHAKYGAGTSVLRARSASGEIVLDQLVLLGDDKGLPEDDD